MPVRILVTAATAVAVRELARDLVVDPALEVATATSVSGLLDQIEIARPAVVLLDTQLVGDKTPQLVRDLTQERNIPVVLRTNASDQAEMILDALEQGALATVPKPSSIAQRAEITHSLIRTLRAAAAASIPNLLAKTEFAKVTGTPSSSILAMGAGIGGLPALAGVLSQLPPGAPGAIVITGLSGSLTSAWAERMALRCALRVKLAANGDTIRSAQVLIAPGDSHLILRQGPGGLTVAIKNGPAVFHQKPSLELLLNSLADIAAASTVAAVFSGAGVDGVAGLLSLRKARGRTIVESPGSAVCGDLPARALRCGAADISLHANEIAQKMLEFAAENQSLCAA